MIDMQGFCASTSDPRAVLHEPFLLADKKHVAATSTKIGIMVSKELCDSREWRYSNPESPPKFGELIDGSAQAAVEWAEWPEKVGKDINATCPSCYSGELECPHCGHFTVICNDCDGSGVDYNTEIPADQIIDGVKIAGKYYALISRLPNVFFAIGSALLTVNKVISEKNRPLLFTFDGGRGIVMPMFMPDRDE